MWKGESLDLAKRQLQRLARSLERQHAGAAAWVREGLDETVTVLLLGLTGAPQSTLRTTNPIENLDGSIAHCTAIVKRWCGGSIIHSAGSVPHCSTLRKGSDACAVTETYAIPSSL